MDRYLVALCLMAVALSGVEALDFNLTGSYKNLLSMSKTPLQEDYNLDLNRLRLDLKTQFSENWSVDLEYDVEAYLGSLLKTTTFTAFKNYRPPTKFDLISPLLDSGNLYLRQKLYRAYFTGSFAWGDLKIGRQKIPWGVARVWNATDPFNPIAFMSLEREERAGVDAVSLELPWNELTGLNLVYVEGKAGSSFGGRLRTNREETDYSVLAAKLGGDYLWGFDFAGQVRGAGVRGEASYTKAQAESDYLRLLLSWDYTFPSSLYFLMEWYYNGQGNNNLSRYQWSRLAGGEIQNLACDYGFAGVTYDLSPRLKSGVYFIYNMDDESRYANPFAEYSLTENALLVIGAYLSSGKAGSEFGALSNIYYAQINSYF